MSIMSQIKMGAILSYIGIVASVVVTLFFTPILIRELGNSEYGVYTLIGSFVGYLAILDMGLGNSIVRYISRTRSIKDKKLESNLAGMFLIFFLLLGILTLIIGMILYFNLDNIFGSTMSISELNIAKNITLVLVINYAISFPLSIYGALIQAYERFVFLKFTNIIKTFLIPLIIVPLLFIGYASVMVVLITSAINIAFLLLNYLYVKKVLKVNLSFGKVETSLIKEILGYSSFIFLNVIVDKIYWSTDQVIIGATLGVNQVAIYSIAMQFIMIYLTMSSAISNLFLPKVSRMDARGERDENFSQLFLKVSRIQALIMLTILSAFYLVGANFIEIWVGSFYENSYYLVLVIMLPLSVILSQSVGIPILQAKNKQKFRVYMYFIIALFNVVVSIPIAKIFGVQGIAIVTAISLIIGHIILMNIYYSKYIGIKIFAFWKMFVPLAFINIVAIYLTQFILKRLNISSIYTNTFEVLMVIFTTLFVYMVILFLFLSIMFFSKEEKYYMINRFRKSKGV